MMCGGLLGVGGRGHRAAWGDLAVFLSQPGDLRTQAIMLRPPDGEDFQHVRDFRPQRIALLPGGLALSLYVLKGWFR